MDSGNISDDHQDFDPTSNYFFNPSPNLGSFYDLDRTRTHNLDHLDLIWSTGLSSDNFDQSQPGPSRPDGAIKNPKKRVRASNRVPTTVLKTDTANFRQMVQEFTGYPAASSLQRPASFFGPVYPVRPSAHKPSFPSLLINPTPVDSVGPTTNAVTAADLRGSTIEEMGKSEI